MTSTLSALSSPEHPPAPRGRGAWFGQLLLRLHFYAGILIGPFLLIAAFSGALYAIVPALEQGIYQRELHAPVTDNRLTLAEQIAIAEEHVNDAPSSRFVPRRDRGTPHA